MRLFIHNCINETNFTAVVPFYCHHFDQKVDDSNPKDLMQSDDFEPTGIIWSTEFDWAGVWIDVIQFGIGIYISAYELDLFAESLKKCFETFK